jgi:flagellar biosynthetic protein FliR
VSAVAAQTVMLAFLAFCRIGGCLALMPGFSSARIPVHVRLFMAVAVTLALTPLLYPVLQEAAVSGTPDQTIKLLVSETLTGLLIGLLARIFFTALEFAGTALAMSIGFSNMMEPDVIDGEQLPVVASAIMLTATTLFFLTDQHWEVLRALIGSYAALPVNTLFASDFAITKLADTLSAAFTLALQVSSPFIVYSFIVNLMFGIINKLTPQIPVYFISQPFVLAGGFLLLFFTVGEVLQIFITAFSAWLRRG